MKSTFKAFIQLFVFLSVFPSLEHALYAQDKILKTDGTTQDAKITGVSGATVMIQVGAGSIGLPLSSISQVTMATPAEFSAATAAYAAKDYAKALSGAKAVSDKYKGLPVDWARQSATLTAECYIELNDLEKAEAAYLDFQKVYPGKGSMQTDIGLARIAFAKKDYATAKQKLDPIKAEALKLKNVPEEVGPAYSKAFYVIGQVEEALGNYEAALQDYLRTVTYFYHDGNAVASAQEKADTLRKEHSITVP